MTDELVQKPSSEGGDATVVLTAKEYKELIESKAADVQAKVNMTQELIDLREKNRKLAEQPQVNTSDISGVVEAELAKRDAENMKVVQANALNNWLMAHPEFSPEEDKDGLKFAAFQKALGRVNLVGIKSEQDYIQVLNDALRLTEQVPTQSTRMIYSSTPQGSAIVTGRSNNQQFLPVEQKLINESFGGDVEKYLKVKAKRPEYIEEILKWVR